MKQDREEVRRMLGEVTGMKKEIWVKENDLAVRM